MLAAAHTFALIGVDAHDVRVEVDVRGGMPAFSLVGLPDAAVRESRERVRAALLNSGFKFPPQRIVASLAPADLRKAGPGFDLAIAAALLAASGQLEPSLLEGVALVGELALDGRVRAVPGALPMTERARRAGLRRIAVAAIGAREAAMANLIASNGGGPPPPIAVTGLECLAQLPTLGAAGGPPDCVAPGMPPAAEEAGPDLADLRGQPYLRRALEVAAAGGHSLLVTGPPGAGKSLAAQRLPSILPPLAAAETIEVLRVASACGRSPEIERLRRRPYRAPHHTISTAGLIGGGTPPRPGEVSLAHRGVLFLDELPEFSRDALEALRQPLEQGSLTLVRARYAVELPCRFMLVAAANPCPCGRGEASSDCECSPVAVRRYERRLSGALADRIDLCIEVAQPPAESLDAEAGEPSAAVRERVIAARERQQQRLGGGRCNAEMTVAETRRRCDLAGEARAVLAQGHRRLGLSGRGHDRVLRVARTLADLAGRERIDADDVHEALSLRRRERASALAGR